MNWVLDEATVRSTSLIPRHPPDPRCHAVDRGCTSRTSPSDLLDFSQYWLAEECCIDPLNSPANGGTLRSGFESTGDANKSPQRPCLKPRMGRHNEPRST